MDGEGKTDSSDSIQGGLESKLSNFIDRHIREIKYVTYGVAAIGAVLIGKSLHVGKKFCKVSDIPDEFIVKHMRLHGMVRDVSKAGVLSVDHTPIINWKFRKTPTGPVPSLLPVHLAGVELLDSGLNWLPDKMTNKRVWFQMLKVNDFDGIDCVVYTRKNIFQTFCVNDQLVRDGFALVQHVQGLPDDPLCKKILARLLQAEIYAEKKGRGVWKKPPLKQRLAQIPASLVDRGRNSVQSTYSSLKHSLISFFRPRRK